MKNNNKNKWISLFESVQSRSYRVNDDLPESVKGGFKTVNRSARTSNDNPQGKQTGLTDDEDGVVDSVDEIAEEPISSSPESIEKNPRWSYKNYGERKHITKDPETGAFFIKFVPKDQPKSPNELDESEIHESAPPGWEKTVLAMKKHKDIKNPWAMAWAMKNKGYHPQKMEELLNKKTNESLWQRDPDERSWTAHSLLRQKRKSGNAWTPEQEAQLKQQQDLDAKFVPLRTNLSPSPKKSSDEMDEESSSGGAGAYSPANWVSKSKRGSEKGIRAGEKSGFTVVRENSSYTDRMSIDYTPEEVLSHELRDHLTDSNTDGISVSHLDDKESPKSIGKSVLIDYSDLNSPNKYYAFVTANGEEHNLNLIGVDEKHNQETIYKEEGVGLDEIKHHLLEIYEWIKGQEEESDEEELSETPFGRKQIKHPEPPMKESREQYTKNMLDKMYSDKINQTRNRNLKENFRPAGHKMVL